MIHDKFFSPYPLQVIQNAIREYLYADRITVQDIYLLNLRKNDDAKIAVFDCKITFENKTSYLTIWRFRRHVFFCPARLIRIGNYFTLTSRDKAFDLNGKSVSFDKILPLIFKARPITGNYFGRRAERLKPWDENIERVDDDTLGVLLLDKNIKSIGWQYEIDLIQNSAQHVICLNQQGLYHQIRDNVIAYGKRISKSWDVFRHSLWRAWRRQGTQ